MESFDQFIKKKYSKDGRNKSNVEEAVEVMRSCILSNKYLEITNLSKIEIEISKKNLLRFEEVLKTEINDWSLEESFFIYNDEDDVICRLFLFSQGLTKNVLIIGACSPLIKFVNNDIDIRLFMDISNLLLDTLVDRIPKIEAKPSLLREIGKRLKRIVIRKG